MTVAWATLRSLIAGLFRRGRVEADMADEIEFHIETRVRDLVARGMSTEVARRTARIEFGSLEQRNRQGGVAWTGADLLMLAFEIARPGGSFGWLELDNIGFYR